MSTNNQNPGFHQYSDIQTSSDLSYGFMHQSDSVNSSAYGLVDPSTSSSSLQSSSGQALYDQDSLAKYKPTPNPTVADLLDYQPLYDLFARGKLVDNGGSDYVGDISNPFDDMKLYAGSELRFNRDPVLPSSAETITIEQDTILGNYAENYRNSPILNITDEHQSILIPDSGSLKEALLQENKHKNTRLFENGLVLDQDTTLENQLLIIRNGDVNFNGSSNLRNMTIIVENGNINLGDVQAEGLQVWASGSIHMNQDARYGGDNHLFTGSGDVIFNGSTITKDESNVQIVANGNVFWNTTINTRAEIRTNGNFIANQSSKLDGAVYAEKDIILNAKVEFSGRWGRVPEAIAAANHALSTAAQGLTQGLSGLDISLADSMSEEQLNSMDKGLEEIFASIPPLSLLENPDPAKALTDFSDGLPEEWIKEVDIPLDSPFPEPRTIPLPTLTDIAPQPRPPAENQPLIGLIDTGLIMGDPQIDYGSDRLILGPDYIDGDVDPLLDPQELDVDSHGTDMLKIISAKRDGIGPEGLNPDAPVWVSRSVGNSDWTLALRDGIEVGKSRPIQNTVINLNFDLVGVSKEDPKGEPITRLYLTQYEYHTLEYARENGALIIASSGNEGESRLAALARSTRYLDNILVVGAAQGNYRAGYSNYGQGLGLLADGRVDWVDSDDPDIPPADGTSAASARVAAAAADVWAANPTLTYRQVIDILQSTATDIGAPGWDEESGAGVVNPAAAVLAALNWSQPPSQLNLQPTAETLWDDFTAWATTYQRPNKRCSRKFWAKFRRIFKKVLKIALKIVGVAMAIVTKGASLLPKIAGGLSKLASKTLVGKALKIAQGVATFLKTTAVNKLNSINSSKWFKVVKNVKTAVDLAMKTHQFFKDLFKKKKTSQP